MRTVSTVLYRQRSGKRNCSLTTVQLPRFSARPAGLPPFRDATKHANRDADCTCESASRNVSHTYSRPTVVHP